MPAGRPKLDITDEERQQRVVDSRRRYEANCAERADQKARYASSERGRAKRRANYAKKMAALRVENPLST